MTSIEETNNMSSTLSAASGRRTDPFPHLLHAVSTMATTSEALYDEIVELRAEVARLRGQSPPPHASEQTLGITGDGSGAGSAEIYSQMKLSNWNGRLGRAHMVDVDRLPNFSRLELDDFLRQQITDLFPVGGPHLAPSPAEVFEKLVTLGLRLENRRKLADVTVLHDNTLVNGSSVIRFENFAAYYYKRGDNWDSYWKGMALETILELARYRGLFRDNGCL